jgi:hypothetical protein
VIFEKSIAFEELDSGVLTDDGASIGFFMAVFVTAYAPVAGIELVICMKDVS